VPPVICHLSPVTRRAFTLIEILVVIGIIAILAGILVPVLARARSSARSTACKSNLSQIAKAVQMYAGEHASQYPFMASRPTLNTGMPRMCDVLKSYAKDPNLFKCPADNQGFFEKEGSSYEWNAVLNGRTQDSWVEQVAGPSRTPMAYDYENFHPDPGAGSWGGKNVVFCDGNVKN
jgi:prepilin-type N-terminal cleavage/methylation domain-containing protein/prepilin-type processing-associated H-X9-DG protein